MSKFKVGDKVRCVDSGGFSGLSCGVIYKVAYLSTKVDGMLSLKINGSIHKFYEHRFVLESEMDYEIF